MNTSLRILTFCSLPGNETSPESFLLHNALARKPKRIRTAFSPSQLLRLEHAFEKNHYVVGAERKQLAHSLSLTETQVRSTGFYSTFHPLSLHSPALTLCVCFLFQCCFSARRVVFLAFRKSPLSFYSNSRDYN